MNLIRLKLAELDQLFDFGNHVIRGGGHHGIEISRRLAIDKIAPAVALPSLDEGKLAANGAFENVRAAIKFTRLFSFRDHSAVARGRKERRNARAACAKTFRERALRIQFHLYLASEDELLEEFVLPHITGNQFLDLVILKEQANAEIVDTRVVADDGEVFCAFSSDGSDQVFRDAAKAEAAHEDGGAIGELFDGSVGGSNAFVHTYSEMAKAVYCIG